MKNPFLTKEVERVAIALFSGLRTCRNMDPYLANHISSYALYDPKVHTMKYACERGILPMIEWLASDADYNSSEIAKACLEHGHLEIFYHFVKTNHFDQDEMDKLLKCAASKGSIVAAKFLLENGATILPYSYALVLACESGHLEMVKYLLSKGARLDDYDMGFISACSSGHLDVAKYLFENRRINGALFEDWETVACIGALISAAKHGHLKVVEYIVEKGTSLDDPYIILCPSLHGHAEVVRYLVNKGINRHYLSDALMYACETGHLNVVQILFDVGTEITNVHVRSAARYFHLDVFKFLILNIKNSLDVKELLILTCYDGFFDGFKIFVEKEKVKPKDLYDALEMATIRGACKIIEYLLDRGLTLNIHLFNQVSFKYNPESIRRLTILATYKMTTSELDLFNHLKSISNLNISEYMNIIRGSEKKGQELYRTYPALRDVSTLMEHPEFYKLYYMYMQNAETFKAFMTLSKVYDMISKELHRRDPEERYHNSYHKLFILYNLFRSPRFSRLLAPRKMFNSGPKLLSDSQE